MCIVNAHRLYEIKNKEKISARDFRTMLMHELAGDIEVPDEGTTNEREKLHNTKQNQHWPIYEPNKGRCWYCYHEKNIRSETRIKCKYCDKYLCVDPCFELFHTR